jgi:hypothetical protein
MTNEQTTKGNTMTHKATKNHAGNYTYRGYTIQHSHQEITDYYGKSATWNIRIDSDEDDTSEHAETLAQAKRNIDFWIDEVGVNN